ncbi:MAG TPA: type II secretion system secretin GspD [Bryobacteraceae bacterium]|nr:type II secretion system secretin GspD [Bryobacteraceae bacterium]
MNYFMLRPLFAAGVAVSLLAAQVASTPPDPSQQQQPQQSTTPAQPAPQAAAPAVGGLDFQIPNGSLTEFIDIVARRLRINYILDPAVGKGSVSLFTYGEPRPTNLMTLLQTVLRVNGATMVQVGEIYRIVPVGKISSLPLTPNMNADAKTLPEDERMILDLIFLKYATAKEIESLIVPFLGEGASHSTYDAANLLILQDNSRNLKRTLQLIDMFDSDTFAGQRVHLFEVVNSRPSDMAKELDTVFKAYALSEKSSAVKFIPVDRINTIIAVAPNPGIFAQVKTWLDKLDVAVKAQAGEVNSYVYRLKYGFAATTAAAITALYTGDTTALMQLSTTMMNGMGMNGLGFGGINTVNGGYGGLGTMGTAAGMYGNYGSYGSYGQMGYPGGYGAGAPMYPAAAQQGPLSIQQGQAPGSNPTGLTGMYLGNPPNAAQQSGVRVPRVVPNPLNNTLLIQATPQEYEQILNLLRQLDIPPRQVLIDARIYEVDLGNTQNYGLTSAQLTAAHAASTLLTGALSGGGLTLTAGLLQTKTRELLAAIQASEGVTRSRSISAPSIIATDSIPATMNVGSSVPTLSSQAVTGIQQGGNSLFTNTISNVSTGMTLNILARVNSSGIVTMVISQDVSAPQSNSSSNIDSPAFSNRSFSTTVTVEDGQMIAIGGGIVEQDSDTSSGVPFLHRIPILGAAFGSKTHQKSRTELVVFITPHVIFDSNQMVEASDEIRDNLKKLKGMIKEDQ